MWQRFKYNQREFEWAVTKQPSRCLLVRSVDGNFHVQCLIHDNVNPDPARQIDRSWVLAPTIIGTEFPLGQVLPNVPVSLDGAFEVAEHGVIHTELVRSLIGRWENRSRYKLPAT